VLTIEGLKKTYAGRAGSEAVRALKGVSLRVKKGDFFALLGPSGCGKTTMLQCIAGLETPDDGRIAIGGSPVFSGPERIMEPANRRGLGMVFQSYAIWPHMSVAENVAFPLQRQRPRLSGGEIARRVREALAMVKLGQYADRPAPHLSGGQQQRVALARALVHEPRLLLLDEPLSNLDAKLRDEMRVELRQLITSLGMTAVFVTHDQVEAMGMADEVALMREGQIIQMGSPKDIYLRPISAFVADFMGSGNLIPSKAIEQRGASVLLATPFGDILATNTGDVRVGEEAILVIRPHAAILRGKDAPQAANVIAGKVASCVFLGDRIEALTRAGETTLQVSLNTYHAIAEGDEISLELPPERCLAVKKDGVAVAQPAGRAPETAP